MPPRVSPDPPPPWIEGLEAGPDPLSMLSPAAAGKYALLREMGGICADPGMPHCHFIPIDLPKQCMHAPGALQAVSRSKAEKIIFYACRKSLQTHTNTTRGVRSSSLWPG